MSFSYSKVCTFWDCPYKYKLIYKDELKTLPDTSPNNALFTGTAIHTGIETRDIDKAVENYKANFTELTEAHNIEILKIKTILQKAIKQIPKGEYEYKLLGDDGFIDCLVKADDDTYYILDFKHSNNIKGYIESPQVLLYKYYFEKLTGFKVSKLFYVFIPKWSDKLTENYSAQDIEKLKQDILGKYATQDCIIKEVAWDEDKVKAFMTKKRMMDITTTFVKKPSIKCKWCEFKKYCGSNGVDKSELVQPEAPRIAQDAQEPMPILFNYE